MKSDADLIVRAHGISKTYKSKAGPVPALRDVSFSLHPGEVVALVGPSGCGKSTLLKILSLMVSPSSGSFWLAGGEAPRLEKERARIRNEFLGNIRQDLAVIEEESVEENVGIPLIYGRPRLSRAERRRRVRLALESVGIDWASNRGVDKLSGGERQRVAIARALINGPRLILADEPTSALDAANVELVMSLLSSVKTRSGSVLVATHDSRVVAKCDRALTLEDGLLTETS